MERKISPLARENFSHLLSSNLGFEFALHFKHRSPLLTQSFPSAADCTRSRSAVLQVVRASDDSDDDRGRMVALDSDEVPEPLGPLAMLLVGFTEEEMERVRNMLVMDLEADMVKLLSCTKAMLGMTLGEALEQSATTKFEQLLRRKTLICSGKYELYVSTCAPQHGLKLG